MVTKRKKKSKRRTTLGSKLGRLIRKLPAERQAELRQTLAWLASDEPGRLTAWWLEHCSPLDGSALEADLADVRRLRDTYASEALSRHDNDPRRGVFKVEAAVILDVFDQWRRWCKSDSECARRVASEKFHDEHGRTVTVSWQTVLNRVKEGREGK